MTQPTAFRLNVPFIKELGVEFISAADGRSLVALTLEPWHLNSWSVAHGGVIMSLLDVAMAVAGRSLNADAGGGVTVEMKTSFLQPAKAGTRLLVSGFAYHRSMTMAFCEGEAQGYRRAIDRQSDGNVQIPKIRSRCRWLNSYRRIVLASRPQGWPSPENFRLEEATHARAR